MGARKRLPFHPVLSKLRTLGTLAVLIAMLGTIVTTAPASAEDEKILQALEATSSNHDASNSAAIRDDERTPNIFADSSDADTADRDNRDSAETGVDGNEYVSPTYGFSVAWDKDIWTPAADEEMVNKFPDDAALDRLVLDSGDATLYIEGRTDFDDGDLEACVDRDIDSIGQNFTISNLDIREDENGDQMAGETADSAFKVITLTMDDTNFTEYIECRPLDEGESVLVITLITKASNLDDATDAMLDVVESIVI